MRIRLVPLGLTAALLLLCAPPNFAAPACPVTVPNGATPPGENPSALHHGNGELWTVLYEGGQLVFGGKDGFTLVNGSMAMKFPFWRGVEGPLRIEGHNLHAPDERLRAHIPAGYATTGFQATGLFFPSVGCWEVTAGAGDASLTFVTQVLRLDAAE